MIRSNSKLYRMLRTLRAEEWERLLEFAASPYHNRSTRLRQLLDLLAPWFPVPEGEPDERHQARADALEKPRIFAALFPGQPYRDSNLSNLMTACTGLIEQFWAYEAFRAQPVLRMRFTAAELRTREGLQDLFLRFWEKAAPDAAGASQDPDSLYQALAFQEELIAWQAEHQPRSEATGLPGSLALLRQFVLTLNLKYYLAAINRRHLDDAPLDTSLQAWIWKYLEDQPGLAQEPPLRLYAGVIRCLLEPEHGGAYTALKAHFEADLDQLAPAEARTLYYTVLNYLNGRLKRDGPRMLPELLLFYRNAYQRGLLFSGGFLDANIYLNLLNVVSGVIRSASPADQDALKDWRLGFVEENRLRLRPDVRDSTYEYARAYLAYQEGAYNQAYRILTNYRSPDMITDMSRRILLVRVFFDAQDPELLDAQVKSALMYLSRADSVAESKRLAYNRFVRLTRRLSALRGKLDAARQVAALRRELLKPAPIECRQWLLEKCAELDPPTDG
ncbi:MAG: hypothetical protein NW241_06675 [Bacteroidia bacterium]|nr:hypothetical protein [Bacteroidia bacterium]